ncbi:MAG: hypothetical protein BWY70_00046 [Bacteroidetes bacterium ADurb.Bin408]|nr:MAG: hypothetical protein BWY70_00046 [Bacteroidetes bacterium ADurb.Bin408]
MITTENRQLNSAQRLILLTATRQVSDSLIELLRELLKNQVDWSFFVQFSVSQGTAPFFYKIIKEHHLETLVPESVFNAVQGSYYHVLSKNVRAQEELKKILKIFNDASIKTLLIKGMASAEYIYGDPGLRPMSDIDLLVENKQLLTAEQLLFDMGFVNTEPYKSYKLRTLNIYNHLNAFQNSRVKIELHHDLSSSHHIIRFPTEKVWDGAQIVNFGDENTHILKDEWNLIYLSIHLVSHFIKKNIRLNNFVDIAELIKVKQDKIDWSFIAEQCKIYNIRLPVFRAFSISRTYFHAPVPNEVIHQLDEGQDALEAQFIHLLNT